MSRHPTHLAAVVFAALLALSGFIARGAEPEDPLKQHYEAATNWTAASPTWTAVTGLPAQAKVRADRVTANKFYGFANGVFYVSTNGTSFTGDRQYWPAHVG